MRKSLIGLIGFIFIAALALNAHAEMPCCMDGPGECMQGGMGGMTHGDMDMMQGMGGMRGMMMADDHPVWKHLMTLGLDDKQKDALKTLRSKTMKDMARKRADKQIAGIELKDLLDKDPVDMKAVEASVKKNESLRSEMFLAHIRMHEDIKAILTPEQRKRLKEMMETGHGPGCGMMGGMMEGEQDHKDMKKEAPRHEHMH